MGIKIGNTDISAIKIGSSQRLPAEYQEVEYIESSGTQCIDTGLTVSGNVKIDFEYMPLESSAISPIFMDDDWRVNGFGSGNTYLYYGGYTSNNEGVSVGSLVQNVKAHDIVAKDGSSRNGGITWIPSSSYPSPTGNLKIFVVQRAGSITSYTQTRLYSYKRYDNGVLTQDLVPCYRIADTEIGLYDLVNDTFFTNVGTGTFTKGGNPSPYKDIQKVYLGSTLVWPIFKDLYQEVEYIESSGGQYINTGYTPTSNGRIDIDFMFLGGNSNTWCPAYGRRGSSNSTYFCLYIQSSSLYMTPNYAGFDPGTSSGVTISKNVRYTVKNDKGQFYLNGVLKTGCSTTNTLNTATYPVFLFDNNITGSPQLRGTKMRLYSSQMYEGVTQVRDLVPCYRKADSVIGLYDKINDVFYTNSGTGTFTKGPDVN